MGVLLAGALGGCEAAGEPGGNRTFSDPDVPFTFEIPADFTDEPINEGDSRGNVIAGAGLTKLDVIAVRRIDGGRLPEGSVLHEVQGTDVVSEVHAVEVAPGFAIECQYTPDHARKIREACRTARDTVERRPTAAQG